MKLGDKAIDCLRFVATTDLETRTMRYGSIVLLWSEKAVHRKLEELARRGYIEYGVSLLSGWLTEKGRSALKASTR